MKQKELIETFIRIMGLETLDKQNKEELVRYLMEEQEAMPAISFHRSYFPYDVNSLLAGEFHSEESGETAKRAYRLVAKTARSQLLSRCEWNVHALQEFSEAGVDSSMAEEYITKHIFDLLKGYGWRYKETLEQAEKLMKGPASGLYGLSEIYFCYGDLAKQMIEDGLKNQPTLITLTLSLLGCLWYKADGEKQEYFVKTSGSLIYCGLKALYREKGSLEGKISGLLTSDSLALYDKVKENALELADRELAIAVLSAACLLRDFGQQFVDAQKLSLMMSKPAFGAEVFHETAETLFQMEKELGLPLRTLTELAADGIFLDEFKKYGVCNAALLEECYRCDRKVFLEVYHKALDEKDRKMLSMSALLCRMEPDSDGQDGGTSNPVIAMLRGNKPQGTYGQQANCNFLSYMSSLQASKILEVIYKEKYVEGAALYEKKGSFEDAEFRYPRQLDNAVSLFIASALLYKESAAAREFFHNRILSYYNTVKGSLGRYGGYRPIQGENPCRFLFSIYMTSDLLFGKETEPEENKERQAKLFAQLADSIGVYWTLDAYTIAGAGSDKAGFLTFAKEHLEEVKKVYEDALARQDEHICRYMDLFYNQDIGMPAELLGRTMEHRLKTVVSHVEEFAAVREQTVRPVIEKLLKSKNKNAKEAAARLVKNWDEGKIAGELGEIKDGRAMAAYVAGICDKASASKIPFYSELMLSDVKLAASGEQAPQVLLEYYLSEYMLLKEVKVLKPCEIVRSALDQDSLRNVLSDLYGHWINNGADTKQKNLLLPYAISAGGREIVELKKQIDEWTENSRGALAAFAVSAMALNGSNMSLLLVDGISKKYKNKQVRAAAEAAMEQAASLLGITKEELGDRIIPDLGFSRDRKRTFDFGSRAFLGVLTPQLTVELFDETGKRIKNLPKPGAKDDAAIAGRTAAEFKDLKKQLKTVVSAQKSRLEEAIITGRTWEREKWEQLFVDNPVMNGFSIGLVWEEWSRDGSMLGTFRYMEDGSFNSSDEEEYELQEDSLIALLHPLDVSEELKETWKQQLEDYEIVQPLAQLDMAVYTLTQEEQELDNIIRFYGKKVYFGTIRGVMEKYDWKRTSIIDGGGYEGYYYEDSASNIGVQLGFDFLYVGMANDEAVTMEKMEFYRIGTIAYGSYMYDEINDKNRVMPCEVPPKLASFALMVGDLLAKKEI